MRYNKKLIYLFMLFGIVNTAVANDAKATSDIIHQSTEKSSTGSLAAEVATSSAVFQYTKSTVDSRTGILSFAIPLGSLSLLDRGSSFTLIANYQQQNIVESTYRLTNHFSMSLPFYDVKTKTVYSSTGQQIVIDGAISSGSDYTKQKFKYHKLDDAEFYYNTKSGKPIIDGSYLAYSDHKEYFNGQGLVDKIEYNNGAVIRFSYNQKIDNITYRVIITGFVPNNSGVLVKTSDIKVSYNGVVTSLIANNQNYITTLKISNNELVQVIYNQAMYGYLYSSRLSYNAGLLSEIDDNNGNTTKISYGTIKAYIKGIADEVSLPVVTKIENKNNTNSQLNIIEYSYAAIFQSSGNYTDSNYTGYDKKNRRYELNVDSQAADALFNTNNGYAYVTQSRSKAANGSLIVTKNTYNHKGLLVEKNITEGDRLKIADQQLSYCYALNSNGQPIYGPSQRCPELDNDTATSQLPKFVKQVSYGKDINGSTSSVAATLTTEQKYNSAGLLDYKKQPNGTVTTTEYYTELNGNAILPTYPKRVESTTIDGYKSVKTFDLQLFHVPIKESMDDQNPQLINMPQVVNTTSFYQSPTQSDLKPLTQETVNWSDESPLKDSKSSTIPLSKGLPTFSTMLPLTYSQLSKASKLHQSYDGADLNVHYLSDFEVDKGVYLTATLNTQMLPNISSVSIYNAQTGEKIFSLSGDAAILVPNGKINRNIVVSKQSLNWSLLNPCLKNNQLSISKISYDDLGRISSQTSYYDGADGGQTPPSLSTKFHYGMDNNYMWTLIEDPLQNFSAEVYNSSGQLIETYDNSSGENGGHITTVLPATITASWIRSTLRLSMKNSYSQTGYITKKESFSNTQAGKKVKNTSNDGYQFQTSYLYDYQNRVIKTTGLLINTNDSSNPVEENTYTVYFDKAPSNLKNSANTGYTVRFGAVKLSSGDYQVNGPISISKTDYTPNMASLGQKTADFVIPTPQGSAAVFKLGYQEDIALNALKTMQLGLCFKTNGLCQDKQGNPTAGYYDKIEYQYNGLGLHQTISAPFNTIVQLAGDPSPKSQQIQLVNTTEVYPSENKQVQSQSVRAYLQPTNSTSGTSQVNTLLAQRTTYLDPLTGQPSCVSIGINNDDCMA